MPYDTVRGAAVPCRTRPAPQRDAAANARCHFLLQLLTSLLLLLPLQLVCKGLPRARVHLSAWLLDVPELCRADGGLLLRIWPRWVGSKQSAARMPQDKRPSVPTLQSLLENIDPPGRYHLPSVLRAIL